MKHLTLPSPAKINLFLHILGKRKDGYHDIQTVFQLINWCDYLSFTITQSPHIRLKTELINTPPGDNLITRAAKLLQKQTSCMLGCDITLNKQIPIGGGFGGGSSNAATTLLALNQLWGLFLPINELSKMGHQLGADVPIFIHGNSAWGEGIGEKLTPMILPQRWFVIISPKCSVQTATLFADPDLCRSNTPMNPINYQPGQGHNDFQAIVLKKYPQITEALLWLQQHGQARLTGTGSGVFAAFDKADQAGRIAHLAPPSWDVRVACGLNHSPLHAKLSKC